jgi:hypothetical protein
MPVTPHGHFVPVTKESPGDHAAEFSPLRVQQEQAAAMKEMNKAVDSFSAQRANELEAKIAELVKEYVESNGASLTTYMESMSALYGVGIVHTRALRGKYNPMMTPAYHLTVQRIFATATMAGVKLQQGLPDDDSDSKEIAECVHVAVDHGPPAGMLSEVLTGDLDLSKDIEAKIAALRAKMDPADLAEADAMTARMREADESGDMTKRQAFVDELMAKVNELTRPDIRLLALAKVRAIATKWGCELPAVDILGEDTFDGVEPDENGIQVVQLGDHAGAIMLPEGLVEPAEIKASILKKFPFLEGHPQLDDMVAHAAAEANKLNPGGAGKTRH